MMRRWVREPCIAGKDIWGDVARRGAVVAHLSQYKIITSADGAQRLHRGVQHVHSCEPDGRCSYWVEPLKGHNLSRTSPVSSYAWTNAGSCGTGVRLTLYSGKTERNDSASVIMPVVQNRSLQSNYTHLETPVWALLKRCFSKEGI